MQDTLRELLVSQFLQKDSVAQMQKYYADRNMVLMDYNQSKQTEKMGSALNNIGFMPEFYSQFNNNQIIDELNLAFNQNKDNFKLFIHIEKNGNYDHVNWKNTLFNGTIRVPKCRKAQKIEDLPTQDAGHKQNQQSLWIWSQAENIILSLTELYKLHDNLKHFLKSIETNQKPANSECTICCNCSVEMVLPCSHSFCTTCTDLYIVSKESKLCPYCRRQFLGSRQSVNQKIYTLYEDPDVSDDLKKLVKDVLSVKNREVIKHVERSQEDLEKIEQIQQTIKGMLR